MSFIWRLLKILKVFFNLIKRIATVIFLVLLGYLISAMIFSAIPVNRNVQSNKEIEIYLLSNGVHLDLILPLKNDIKDWTQDLWINPFIVEQANWVSFGWGDRDFYIKTPEWKDLTLSTAFKAMFLNKPTAIHIDYYRNMHDDENCRIISINEKQYKALVKHLEQSFQKDLNNKTVLISGLQYAQFDSFYEARGAYHIFKTCNTWTNSCLKEAGLRACLWTPFDKGLLFQYRK